MFLESSSQKRRQGVPFRTHPFALVQYLSLLISLVTQTSTQMICQRHQLSAYCGPCLGQASDHNPL